MCGQRQMAADGCSWPRCGPCADSSAASGAADLTPGSAALHGWTSSGPAARGRPTERPRPDLPRTCRATPTLGAARPVLPDAPSVLLGPLDVDTQGRRTAWRSRTTPLTNRRFSTSSAVRALCGIPFSVVILVALVEGLLWGGWGSNPRPRDYEIFQGAFPTCMTTSNLRSELRFHH